MKTTFFEWYTKAEEDYKGIVSPTIAAKLIGITTQHLNRIISTGRIQRIYYEKTPFIKMAEVYEEIARRETKEEQKRAEEAGEYVNLEPRIYPEPEVTEWRNEILQQYLDRRGGTPKEVELEYFDKKLAEWKKTADPARVKKLEEKTKQIIQRKYITV